MAEDIAAEASLARAPLLLAGPSYPFRGGIAQHTSRLLEALRAGPLPSTRLISFRRMYPEWLYPGGSQLEPGYASSFRLEGVDYRLDGINPLTWFAEVRRWQSMPPSTLLMPWWTVYWGPFTVTLMRGARRAGMSTMLLIHNLEDHEDSAWKPAITSRVLALADAFISHNESDMVALAERFPHRPVLNFPHPAYVHFKYDGELPPRRAPVELLFFGLVRPYKGVDVLVEALAGWKGGPVALTVAGEWWSTAPALRASLDKLSKSLPVEVRDHFLAEDEVAALMRRADIVVLPYRSATNSGVLGLAHHYGKPVVASRVGALARDVIPGIDGELSRPGDAAALRDAIKRMVNRGPASYRDACLTAAAGRSWAAFAGKLAGFVTTLAQPGNRVCTPR